MKVYHETILRHAIDICNNGIKLNKSNKYLDFGKGFYVTSDIEMAKNMARRASALEKRKKKEDNAFPTIISFEYKENLELNYKKFEYEDIEWAKFIMANRLTPKLAEELNLFDSNIDLKYDIVIGGTAHGSVANIASNLRYGELNTTEYNINLADFLKQDGSSYGVQIVFCTENTEINFVHKYTKCDTI